MHPILELQTRMMFELSLLTFSVVFEKHISIRKVAPNKTPFIFTSRSPGNVSEKLEASVKSSFVKPAYVFEMRPTGSLFGPVVRTSKGKSQVQHTPGHTQQGPLILNTVESSASRTSNHGIQHEPFWLIEPMRFPVASSILMRSEQHSQAPAHQQQPAKHLNGRTRFKTGFPELSTMCILKPLPALQQIRMHRSDSSYA